MKHIKTIKIYKVNTRSKLERVLFNFHNVANNHANNPQFEWAKISVYKKTNVKNVFMCSLRHM